MNAAVLLVIHQDTKLEAGMGKEMDEEEALLRVPTPEAYPRGYVVEVPSIEDR